MTTLDSSGAKVAELRYQPFGSVRYTWGVTPTDYRYTGQRLEQNVALVDYGARWYKPALGRFIQPDTIVPEPGNPQSLNRYSYVLNNPLKYTDPTGHTACYDTGLQIGPDISQADCWAYGADKWGSGLPVAPPAAGQGYDRDSAIRALAQKMSPLSLGLSFLGNWSEDDKVAAIDAVLRVGAAMSAAVDWTITAIVAFKAVFGHVTFRMSAIQVTGYLCRGGRRGVTCYENQAAGHVTHQLIVHELGHVFDNVLGLAPRGGLEDEWDSNPNFPRKGQLESGLAGEYGKYDSWQQTPSGDSWEEFADMFIGWTYDRWEASPAGNMRAQWMTTNMAVWINSIVDRCDYQAPC